MLVGIAVAYERTRANAGGDVEMAGIGAVGHGRPDRTACCSGLNQSRLFPERLEEAARFLVFAKGCRTLRHDRVADRIGLGLCSLLSRLLRHRAFLDADQRFAVGAVEAVDPAGLTGFRD